jgi:hypothetical protein
MRLVRLVVPGLLALALLLAAPTGAPGHGGEAEAPAPAKPEPGQTTAGAEKAAEKAEVAALARQPARVLAQQALALLEVRQDTHEAGVRLDAALLSKDKADVDVTLLTRATQTLDGGDPEGAIPLLDQALSRPLGSDSGKALHEAERAFSPAQNTQEVVGIVAGAIFLLAGTLAIAMRRKRATPAA